MPLKKRFQLPKTNYYAFRLTRNFAGGLFENEILL